MPEDNVHASRNYSVPKKIKDKALKTLREKALEQIAQSQLLAKLYRAKADEEQDEKKSAGWEQKAMQVEDAQLFNVEFLEFYK